MTFTVTGLIDSVPYRVGVHDEPIEAELHGCVMGSSNATALLSLHVGETVQETPVSSPVTLDLADPVSVLAFLRAETTVTLIEGDVPTTPDDLPVAGAIH